MNKVLVIGHSPGPTDIMKKRNRSASLNRLNSWLDACGVRIYSFSNLSAHHVPILKKSDIDETLIKECVKGYTKIITLGNEVAHYFKKLGVEHFAAPHPSPLNRKFNDKTFEPALIKSLQKYLNVVEYKK